jgi:integrase
MPTVLRVENAKPRDKLSDGNGLHLLVKPKGSKLWRLRYYFAGTQNMLSLGSFPEVSLAAAREKRDAARKLVAEGKDPSQQRKLNEIAAATAANNTFGAVAEEHIATLEGSGRAAVTIAKKQRLPCDLAAPLSKRPIAEITPAEILVAIKKVEKLGQCETARRLRATIGRLFRLAVATLRAPNDPTYSLKGALAPPVVIHRPAITDERELGALMLSIDEYAGRPTVKAAMKFLALTMARPVEVQVDAPTGNHLAEIDLAYSCRTHEDATSTRST